MPAGFRAVSHYVYSAKAVIFVTRVRARLVFRISGLFWDPFSRTLVQDPWEGPPLWVRGIRTFRPQTLLKTVFFEESADGGPREGGRGEVNLPEYYNTHDKVGGFRRPDREPFFGLKRLS